MEKEWVRFVHKSENTNLVLFKLHPTRYSEIHDTKSETTDTVLTKLWPTWNPSNTHNIIKPLPVKSIGGFGDPRTIPKALNTVLV